MGQLLAAVCVCAGATVANAQDARSRFNEGNIALEASRFADARDHFRASLALERNAATAFNLAIALTRTGELVEAVDLFNGLLEGDFGRIDRAQRGQVDTLRQDAVRGVAVLTVELPPVSGLEIRIDGQRALSPARLDPGSHVVLVTTAVHQPVEATLELDRGERRSFRPTLQVSADRITGRVVVDATDGGHLEIAGVAEAIDHLDVKLVEGTYELTLRSGGRERTRTLVVEAGSTNRYEIALAPRRRPWLWALGAIVLVGAATTAIVVTRTSQPPREDPVYGTIITLSR